VAAADRPLNLRGLLAVPLPAALDDEVTAVRLWDLPWGDGSQANYVRPDPRDGLPSIQSDEIVHFDQTLEALDKVPRIRRMHVEDHGCVNAR
jgi:hypothetical protein